jgi:uncharacterized phage protein gp47/JayE
MPGVTPTGFERPTLRELLEQIQSDQISEIHPAWDVSPETVIGQVNAIVSRQLGIAWETLEICYGAFDPDRAEDFLMVSLAKLTGTERRAATQSAVLCTIDLDEETELIAGEHFAHIDGRPDVRWTPQENFTAPADGEHSVMFVSEATGPIAAGSGTITVIATSVVGWNSITNPDIATLGRNIDSIATLRQRREEQLAATGSATIDAIRADVLSVEGVDSCKVFENDSDATVDGMPPKSVEVLVYDGESPAAADNEIAQAIWNSKAGGIQTVGSSSGTALDALGGERTVNFTRPEPVPVFIEITVLAGPGYTAAGGDSALADFIVAEARKIHGVGDDVKWRRVDSLAFKFDDPGVTVSDVSTFLIATVDPPMSAANISITDRQIAAFAVPRVAVTSS